MPDRGRWKYNTREKCGEGTLYNGVLVALLWYYMRTSEYREVTLDKHYPTCAKYTLV